MSATDELRRMLDERGVEWWQSVNMLGCVFTRWYSPLFSDEVVAMENGDGELELFSHLMTPEQAIAATLGTGTCHDLAVTPAYRDKTKFECSECGYEYSAVGGFGCDYGDEPDFNYCPNCGRCIVGPTTNDVDAEVDA